MAIKIVINGEAVTLPDLPAATLASHPYAYIRYHWDENTQTDEIYLTTVSVPVQFDPSQDALVAEGANYVTHLALVGIDEGDQWAESESGDSISVCEDVADYALAWANFDILTLGSGDLYFADSTAAGSAAEAGMRYITDDNDRLLYVSFGADIVCDGQSCTGYTGSVPEGYASLEAWYLAQADQLHKWTVVAGALTLDDTAAAPATDKTPMYKEDYVEASSWVDLWKNATPSADFAEQTLTIDGLDACNLFLVQIAWSTDYPAETAWCTVSRADESQHLQMLWSSSSYIAAVYRTVTVDESGLTFGTGYEVEAVSSRKEDAKYAVPLRIMGTWVDPKEEATT